MCVIDNVSASNFRLTSRTIIQPNGGTREVPCYSLTKTGWLLGSGPEVKSLPLGSGPEVKSQATVLRRQTRGLRQDPRAAPSPGGCAKTRGLRQSWGRRGALAMRGYSRGNWRNFAFWLLSKDKNVKNG